MINFSVFVLGGDHYNTYGIVRSLGEKGIKTIVAIIGATEKDSFVLRSKYIVEKGAFIKADDSISFLLSKASHSSKNIVICCSDAAEELVLSHYEELKDLFILPVCSSIEDQKAYMSKSVITKLAEDKGIEVPRTWKAFNRQIPNDIIFPCITKPETSTSGSKSDIVKCCNRNELESVIYDEHRCANYTIQQFIDYEKEISILGAVLHDGTVVFSGCIDKIRTCMIGTSSFARMVDNNIIGDNKSKLEELIKRTSYRGLFSAEYLLKDARLYFLEINFRNDGNTYVATASGQNLPYIYVQSCLTNKVLFKSNTELKFPTYFMLDIEDFFAFVFHRKGNVFEWSKNLKQADCCLVYNSLDTKPFLKKARTFIKEIIRRVISRIV